MLTMIKTSPLSFESLVESTDIDIVITDNESKFKKNYVTSKPGLREKVNTRRTMTACEKLVTVVLYWPLEHFDSKWIN